MTQDHDTTRQHGPQGSRAWIRPLALVVSCLIIGFVGGWVLRGDDGPVTVLAPPEPGTSTTGTTTTGTSTTATGTTTGASTTTAPTSSAQEPATPPPDRSQVSLAVLNGVGTTGLAGQTADQAESLGYASVATGDAPVQTGKPSIVYYRGDNEAAADRAGSDLGIAQVQALPAGGPVASAAQAAAPDADVIVVLGPG
ncbi:MAG: LytR C-terminal domain-containing protein [Thermoleophilia bacterium]